MEYIIGDLTYEQWIAKVKELGGYYIQPDEGDLFYFECWQSGLSPQRVTDYLNEEPTC